MQGTSETIRVIKNARHLEYALVANGLVVGGIAILYRIMLDRGEKILHWVLVAVRGSLPLTLVWFAGLTWLTWLVSLLVKWEPTHWLRWRTRRITLTLRNSCRTAVRKIGEDRWGFRWSFQHIDDILTKSLQSAC